MRNILIILFAVALVGSLGAQTSQVVFGKNRVQHHRDFDEWMKYESDNFITYWYGEGRNIGQAVVQIAEHDFAYVQSILEHRLSEKLQIIVYVDLTDLKQSNIGNDEAFTNVAGQTKIAGNKIFVYFNGDHNDLRRQIREGVAAVYLEAMLFGASLQEMVQNAVLLNLPDWFKLGLVKYVGQEWSTEQDDRLRQLMQSGQYETFEELAEAEPLLVGQAFWYYVAELYSIPTVSNLLYLTRINRSVENGFLYVLGSPYHVVLRDWQEYFNKRYKVDSQNRLQPGGQPLSVKNKRQLPLTQLIISPDGQRVAYVLNDIGRYRVYIQDVATGEREVIFKKGFRNAIQATDYNYPLLAWNPSGQELAILYEHRDVPKLIRYSLLEKKAIDEDLSTEYHRVNSMAYVNPASLVFSATVSGFSDIFMYYPATRQSQRITTDFWDDLDPVPVKVRNRNGILFASNRTSTSLKPSRLDTVLPIATYDIFYYDLSNRPAELVRVTDTPLANERQPMGVDTFFFSYLSDRSGFYNREVGYLEDYVDHYQQIITLNDGTEIVLHADSSLTKLDTTLIDTIAIVPVIKGRALVAAASNYSRNLMFQNVAERTGRLLEYFPGGRHTEGVITVSNDTIVRPLANINATVYQYLRYRKLAATPAEVSSAPPPNQIQETAPTTPIPVAPVEPAPPVVEVPILATPPATPADSTDVIDIDNYLFQSEFAEEEDFAVKPETTTPPPAPEAQDLSATPTPAAIERPKVQPPTRVTRATASNVYPFRPGRITPYRTTFRTDFVTFNMDNNLLFEGLDTYAANPEGFNNQPLSLLLKANFKDLLEDYVIEGGMRLPTSFNGTEYFLTLNSRKRRLDRFFAVYRRNQRFLEPPLNWRRENNVVLGQYGVRYPLDVFQSLRATATLRRDRVQYIATDQRALSEAPAPTNTQRIGVRLEYVFDNTIDIALNAKVGTRFKVYNEYYKQFGLTLSPAFQFNFRQGFMGVAGLDARHYLRLDKRSILAFRAAGAVSFGNDRILYYLGGADNELFGSFNTTIPIPPVDNVGFVALANSLRGFGQNIRNGNSYVLANAEVRVPIFRYISERIQSPFFRNFQAVAFFDAGTAWSGNNPYSEENPLNTSFFPTNTGGFKPVSVKVVYFRDPLVFSYGIGARTLLFGYHVRLDYAWGLETRNVLDPRLHLSLGMDF